MLDLSNIKDEKLRKLIEESVYFSALTEEEQKGYLDRILQVPDEKVEELCAFFEKENKAGNEKVIEQLKGVYEEFLDLENKIKKMIDQDPEKKSLQGDEKRLDELLDELDKT